MKIVVSHPGINPFVKNICKAFYDADILEKFNTTFVADNNSVLQRIAINLANLTNYDLDKQLNRRRFDEIPQNKIDTYMLVEIIRTLFARAGIDARLIDFIFDWNVKKFSKYVGKNLGNSTAIYGYEYCCLETFEEAKKKRILKIYDVPSPEHDFVTEILDNEYKSYGELQTPYYKYTRNFKDERTKRRRKEWELADIVIANSKFTKKSYENAGLDTGKAHILPYGCPEIVKSKRNKSTNNGKVNFIWAGTFGIRKGAHYLIDALKALDKKKYSLNIYGAWTLPRKVLNELPESVKITKTVPYDELSKRYLESDVLIFPTICDGFGMVISEAFSHGLPVITTNRAGGADLINNGQNGFVIEHSSSDAIVEVMNWFIQNQDKIYSMKKNAYKTARQWQWDDYRKEIVRIITNYKA